MEHNSVIALFLALGIIIAAARGAGALARRLNQPRVLGELIVGVILGPTLFDLLHTSSLGIEQAHLEDTIHELAALGVLLLMFKIGLEIHLEELLRVGLVALAAGVFGAVLPVMLTLPVLMLAGYSWQTALFSGVALAATSVSISAQVLLEINVLHTKEGSALLAAALVDDVFAILLVSVTIAVTGPTGVVSVTELAGIIGRMAAFIGVALAAAWVLLPRLAEMINRNPADYETHGIPAFALIMALLFGWSAEIFGGVAAITGAFIAGIGFSRSTPGIKNQIETTVSSICYAFLVPIFFVSVGLQTDLSGFPLKLLPLALVMILVAVLSKVVGCGLGAHWAGFTRAESLRLGVCMISRGEVGLIIVALGLSTGVFQAGEPLFAVLFLVILFSTVVTPPLVRWVFRERVQHVVETGAAHHPSN